MYLSKITNVRGDNYFHHQVVKHAFPNQKVLFRSFGNKIKVLSSEKPSVDKTFNGSIVDSIKSVETPETNSVVFFNVLLNPTKHVRIEGKNKSKTFGILNSDEVQKWVTEKFSVNGASLLDVDIDTQPLTKVEKKGTSIISHLVSGTLEITDKEKFGNLLSRGMGDAQYIGYGMVDVW